MSTRITIACSPELRGYAIHIYREIRDDRIYVDISQGYGLHFPIVPGFIHRYRRRKRQTP